jgi:ComF family protein
MVNGHLRLHSCLLCAGPAEALALCRACRDDLPWNGSACPRCALPLGPGRQLCAACLERPPLQARTLAPLRYEFPVDHLVAGLKYHRRLEHAPLLGTLLRDAVLAADALPCLLLPLALHRDRLAERGYNQALEIARPLARALGLPLETRLLYRHRATAPQMSLDAAARARNPDDAFALDENRLARLGRISRVALIDDVMTTGATLAAAARVLARAGVEHIEYWVVARTP